jgi:hypothetical protein
MGPRAGLLLAAALLASGCAVVKVAKLPPTTALRDQTATQQRLDAADCKAEIGYRTNYNGDDSPLANTFRNLFFFGASGAAVGGLFTGLPVATGVSPATDGVIAGAGAGGITGGAVSVGGASRFEREWIACMESRGYGVVATPRPVD